MIGDVVSDAIHNIQEYQKEMPEVYDDIKPEIDKAVVQMVAFREWIDKWSVTGEK